VELEFLAALTLVNALHEAILTHQGDGQLGRY
jgi:hypothetical protein